MSRFPKVVVFLGVSLDGFIAGPGGDLSWLADCASESPAETGYNDLMATTDALVLGRNTYDAVRSFNEWPFGTKPVYVLTHRPLNAGHGERAVQGSMEQVLRTVHESGARAVYLDGGDVVRQALQAHLVDELVLSWVPVVLGEGNRLFGEGLPPSCWRLTHSRGFQSGMVQASYRKAGDGNGVS